MRLLLLTVGLLLAACDSTPTDLLSDPAPTLPTADPGAPPSEGFAVVARGTLSGVGGYRASGRLVAYRHTDGRQIVRLEGADIQGGPDLKVWLVERFSGDVVAGHQSLGPLRSTRGDQNYSVSSRTDLSAFVGVSIWCEEFSVGFGQASLSPTTL